MKWSTKDVDLYLQAREYVDTAVIPLIPISWGDQIKKTVGLGEFTSTLAQEVERQFKGRIILFPAFTYSINEGIDQIDRRLEIWSKEIAEHGLPHLIFLTSDLDWKEREERVPGSLISIPAIPLEHVEDKYKQSIIQDQMKQMISIFMNIWQR